MKKFLEIVKFIGLFLWQLPQNIIALVMMPFLGKLRLVKYDKYCFAFEGKKMSGGITLGSFIFLSPYCAKRETTIAHEYGHVVDSHRMGLLFLFIVGLPSILNAAFNFTSCYYDWYPERLANKHAGLGVDSKCRLYFIDKPDYKKNK